MSWVDEDGYFGPDRRQVRAFRLFDRRQGDGAQPAPSLGALLRKLQIRASSLNGDAQIVSRYRTHIQSVADLARDRGETDVERCLRVLEHALQARNIAPSVACELVNRHLQNALAALR